MLIIIIIVILNKMLFKQNEINLLLLFLSHLKHGRAKQLRK